jgi:hypothetical protein
MSDATITSTVPQVPVTRTLADIPWYGTATPEQRDGVEADYARCAKDITLDEYITDATTGWSTAAEYLADAGWTPNPVVAAAVDAAAEEVVPSKASDVWTRYAEAVDAYAVSESAKQLAVGKWAHKYLLAYVGSEADTEVRKSRRAAAVRRCQDYITDQCGTGVPVSVDKAIRLHAVASVYGAKEASKLGIGKLRAFEPSLYRDKDTEAWGWKDSVTEEQQAALRELWTGAVAGVLLCTADELTALVGKAMGKAVAEKKPAATDTAAKPVKPGEVQPAVVSKATGTPEERAAALEVAPEDPVACARRMASLPYGRPDSALVWRNVGSTARLSEADAAALVAGMCDVGQLTALTALAKAAVQAVAKLQAAAKTAEAARAMAAA